MRSLEKFLRIAAAALVFTAFFPSRHATEAAAAEIPVAKSPAPKPAADNELPYVYTHWKHFTTADGLPTTISSP